MGVLDSHNLALPPLEKLKNQKPRPNFTALWNAEKKIPKNYPYSRNQLPLINKFQKSENNCTTFYGYYAAHYNTENKFPKNQPLYEK